MVLLHGARDNPQIVLTQRAMHLNSHAGEVAFPGGMCRHDPQLGDGMPAALLGMPRATIREMASASTVVLMAPDLKEELPVLYLRLRDAVVNGSTKIIEFTSTGSGLTRHAWRSVRHGAGDISTAVTETLADAEVQAQLSSGPVVVIASLIMARK